MSKSLFRQILLSPNLKQVTLDPNAVEQPDAVLLYIGKKDNLSPVRLKIEETMPSDTNTMMAFEQLGNFNNPTLDIENSYENLVSAKVCLDNWVNETPSCVNAIHEAHVSSTEMGQGIFPLELEINGDVIVFPYGTETDAFLDVLSEYGIQVLGTTGVLSQ